MQRSAQLTTVLFACLHNVGRSQMAAALFNRLVDPAKAHAISAGTRPAERVNPQVVAALAERGIEIAGEKPRLLTPEVAAGVHWLVTMGCGDECPVVPGARVEDWPLDDPAGQPLEHVREIRDEIERRVRRLIETQGWGNA